MSTDMAGEATPELPQTTTQVAVADIWAEALHVDARTIRLHDSFESHGGRSLSVFLVLTRLHERFGVELSAAVMFEDPTVFRLAQQVDALLVG